jgi:hypothetical protein
MLVYCCTGKFVLGFLWLARHWLAQCLGDAGPGSNRCVPPTIVPTELLHCGLVALPQDTPQGKLLLKDDARGCIDGTIFYK